MQLVTVGTKYQIVIPKEVRRKVKGIRPGAKVGVLSASKDIISIRPAASDWVDRTYGMMKDAWKNIDPIAELEKMRNEW